jgi:hypothetical protein
MENLQSRECIRKYILACLPGIRKSLLADDGARDRRYGERVVTFDDVASMAMTLPASAELDRRGSRTWSVKTNTFAWERPFTKADIKRFGHTTAPTGPILAVRVDDLDEKEAVLAVADDGFFTIPHFDGFPAVLIQLDVASHDEVREAVIDAWMSCAPPALVERYLGRG